MNRSATNTDEYLQTLPKWQQDNLQVFRDIIHEIIKHYFKYFYTLAPYGSIHLM